ncbi:uncharacterized protein PSFLO_02578 [Pseudozyma flocculosa]|uniref:Uncharacterized protein n=1 Tax=Pseudozyma flocculosa TaxID=84751 RepID=A0A5C3EZQ1_9BASI|nr:uncharacterized protein PSFLO_02578 [Pseudozyma flocculosa]
MDGLAWGLISVILAWDPPLIDAVTSTEDPRASQGFRLDPPACPLVAVVVVAVKQAIRCIARLVPYRNSADSEGGDQAAPARLPYRHRYKRAAGGVPRHHGRRRWRRAGCRAAVPVFVPTALNPDDDAAMTMMWISAQAAVGPASGAQFGRGPYSTYGSLLAIESQASYVRRSSSLSISQIESLTPRNQLGPR